MTASLKCYRYISLVIQTKLSFLRVSCWNPWHTYSVSQVGTDEPCSLTVFESPPPSVQESKWSWVTVLSLQGPLLLPSPPAAPAWAEPGPGQHPHGSILQAWPQGNLVQGHHGKTHVPHIHRHPAGIAASHRGPAVLHQPSDLWPG